MTIACPHCASELAITEDMINQRVQCPICNREFLIGSENAFCSHCGAALAPGAQFCMKCGGQVGAAAPCANVPPPAPVAAAPASAGWEMNNVAVGRPPEKFAKLLKTMWTAIGLEALSCVFALGDVREYYTLGRFGFLLFGGGVIALYAWLVKMIAQRKNWARVTYVAFSILYCVLNLLGGFSDGGNAVVGLASIAALATNLYCVVMLLKEPFASCFFKCGNGVGRALIFWGVFVGYMIVNIVYAVNHQSTHEYRVDRATAASRGSHSAQEEMREVYGDDSDDYSYSYSRRTSRRSSSGKIDWSKDWPKISKILMGLVLFCNGLFGKKK